MSAVQAPSVAPQILVERAIMAQLVATRRLPNMPVESYAAQLDDELFAWVRTLPAVWVTFEGSTTKRVGARSFKVSATFEVLCAQRNLAQDEARLNDAAQGHDLGVYQLVEDCKLALANQSIGLPITPFTPGAVRAVMKGMVNRDAVAIYGQSFATDWMELLPEPSATPAGTLAELGLNYFLKPGDDVADAADVVSLAN